MPRKKQKSVQTKGSALQPRPTPSAATVAHTHSYLNLQETGDTVVTVSHELIESLPNTSSRPKIPGHDDFIIRVYKIASPPLDSHFTSSNWRQGPTPSNMEASDFPPAAKAPSAVDHPTFSSIPSQISYQTVPPPASLTENRRTKKPVAIPSRSSISSMSPGYSTANQFRPLRDLNGASLNEQSEMLPGFMENLHINDSSSSFIASPRPTPRTTIKYSLEYVLQLRSFVYSEDTLQRMGYIINQLSEEELERKKRCLGCGKSMPKRKVKDKGKERSIVNRKGGESMAGPDIEYQEQSGDMDGESHSIPTALSLVGCSGSPRKPTQDPPATLKSPSAPESIVRCRFHNGVKWSCCGNHVSSDPCTGNEFHVPRQYPKGKLESAWTFYATPSTSAKSDIRPAVAIDCEMGTSKSGDSELIRVTLIDYFSSTVLVDSLVYPDVEMEHYNTRFSGVTRKDIEIARQKRQCFIGKLQARKALWQFVGPNTIVVGHSAHSDLTALRWIHPIVVDTQQIEYTKARDAKAKAAQENKEAESPAPVAVAVAKIPTNDQQPRQKRTKGSGALSLKTLALVRLGRDIQTRGRKGHDSLEDATAARDLAHWNVMNKDESKAPDTFNKTSSLGPAVVLGS